MKGLILSATILTLGVLSANAQSNQESKDLKFSIGAEGALPLGDFKTTSNFGIGGSAQVEYRADESVALTFSAGYLTFSGKGLTTIIGFDPNTFQPIYGTAKYTINIIPVLAGGKYYFTDNVFGSAQLGISFFSTKGSSGSSAFTYAPGIGFNVSSNFDLLLKYQAATKSGSTISFVGLRAAYSF